ncbi:MAG: metallophosphoesterase [Actinomycetota bacterium]
MVRWFDPHQLVDTVARVVVSGVWSSYADSRELQAMVPSQHHDRSDLPELWLDYVSDLGDGWNSTYTVARLLAREELELAWDGDRRLTRRGRILIMGGDQVYPVPKRTEYENRLIGPYRAAMPCAPHGGPDLFAIPGSHDWYDGLINFTNVFCRGRPIGGWSTSQTRSYFALKLPHRWWLWGVDMQFGDYLDEAQLRYFSDAAAAGMEPGDRIIVCMATEVESGRKSAEVSSDRNLEYLEREVVQPAGGRVVLHLKSGRHYYCRYQEEGGAGQLITAGGGGAFMHPTHDLPERSDPHADEGRARYRRAAVYPSVSSSKRLRKRVFLLPAYNLPLAAVLGGAHILLAFMLNLHLRSRYLWLSFGELRRALWESPTAFLLILLILATFGGLVRLAHEASGATRLLVGFVHSVMLFTTLAAVMIAASRLSSGLGAGLGSLLAFLGIVAVLGGIGGVLGIAGYFWATNLLGFHGNEAYAPLHHADYKNFLRLHIDTDGALTVYPVAIDRVGRKWQCCPEAPAHAPWLAPLGAEPASHLIEAPIRVDDRLGPGG